MCCGPALVILHNLSSVPQHNDNQIDPDLGSRMAIKGGVGWVTKGRSEVQRAGFVMLNWNGPCRVACPEWGAMQWSEGQTGGTAAGWRHEVACQLIRRHSEAL